MNNNKKIKKVSGPLAAIGLLTVALLATFIVLSFSPTASTAPEITTKRETPISTKRPTQTKKSPTKTPTETTTSTTTPSAVTPENLFASSDIKFAIISGEVFKVNMRRTPGFQDKNNETDVVAEIDTGTRVKVLGGPQLADGLNWWYVEWMNFRGWIAETTRTGKIILVFDK